ncbi:MAG: CinA family protein [Proteobacteria bacterium]|nr:CinA family protein [Pseudomonadota bacterium]
MRGADIAAEPAWQDLVSSATALRGSLLGRGWMLGCAESCTGGLVAAAMTSIAGSSEWFERGFVTYSNRSKTELLGVSEALLAAHGAVSREVALAMVRGVLAHAPVQAALAVTGIAGPGGGSPDKPVGLVWFGWAWRQGQGVYGEAESVVWPGDRQAVRMASAHHALAGMQLRLAALLKP